MANADQRQHPILISRQASHLSNPLEGQSKYQMLATAGKGAFGFVHLYRNTQTGEQVAIKFIERGDRMNKYVAREVLNHRLLRHPNVIEFKEVFLTSKHICIAMEYANGGNLFNYVQQSGPLQEPVARFLFQHLLIGLDYSHRLGVVNRDIKLDNTLLEIVPTLPLPLPKICDFGYSKSHSVSNPKTKVGTAAYMAPEVICGSQDNEYDGKPADIWSCGVLLYVLLFGRYPFDTPQNVQEPGQKDSASPYRLQYILGRILSNQWSFPPNIPVSPECRDLLLRILVAQPGQRLTMRQIHQHPWFLENLPTSVLNMNDQFLANTDYSGVQTEEEIAALLEQAKKPASIFDDMFESSYQEVMARQASSVATSTNTAVASERVVMPSGAITYHNGTAPAL